MVNPMKNAILMLSEKQSGPELRETIMALQKMYLNKYGAKPLADTNRATSDAADDEVNAENAADDGKGRVRPR